MSTSSSPDTSTDAVTDDPAPNRTIGVNMPERPSIDNIEERWIQAWEEQGTYTFDRTKHRDEVYSIDTPPPTVSGSLHVGHVFSYTQTDVMARYQRMSGKEVFYPIGWDDNGLPTERRVQNYYGVRCDPSIPYDPNFVAPESPHHPPIAISRPNFVELCSVLTTKDEAVFERLFRRLGLSVDWRQHYTTIGPRAQRISQRGFLRMLKNGQAYRQEAPTLWDVDFQSSVAQAELEDRETVGAYHRIRFHTKQMPTLVIETTRPELLAACVALVAHPDDPRYQTLFGTQVTTPLFEVEIPVLAHPLAEPEKGSGIAMVCTFGDLTDVIWWRELSLETRTIVGRDGRLEHISFGARAFPSIDPSRAQLLYDEIAGKTTKQARARVVDQLRDSGDLVDEPRAITHAVKYYERGERPLEIVSSRQWYVKTLELADDLIRRGREIDWHPPFMRARYESWIEGLNGDWNISRQRFFGVPFPLWYRIGEDGSIDDLHPIFPDEARLPIDPSVEVPEGYDTSQRGMPGGFTADPDVMDTWATSSLTPEIAGNWEDDPDLFERIFPMDLRPQAHEIIRTWLFSSVVRSHSLHQSVPWTNAAISGWILDPDRKKMSKSVGNVVVPTELLETKGTDAVRYWASSARLGVDTIFDDRQMQIGRRLAIKILNASKFILTQLGDEQAQAPRALDPLDESMLGALRSVVTASTLAFSNYEQARALELSEQFFWDFCDNYLELVKNRAYRRDEGAESAKHALGLALSVLLRLFAPFLPFATEEVWSWWLEGSIHRAPWPRTEEFGEVSGDPEILAAVSAVLGEIRKAKTNAKQSMRVSVSRVTITADAKRLGEIGLGRGDLIDAGSIVELELVERAGQDLDVSVELADPD
ncbi:MAG TPA: valine--tRNA ligase [Acidimicrobiales bacterium]|nr:valine--tRNA ligase [Acidimicrobiales bacterium]